MTLLPQTRPRQSNLPEDTRLPYHPVAQRSGRPIQVHSNNANRWNCRKSHFPKIIFEKWERNAESIWFLVFHTTFWLYFGCFLAYCWMFFWTFFEPGVFRQSRWAVSPNSDVVDEIRSSRWWNLVENISYNNYLVLFCLNYFLCTCAWVRLRQNIWRRHPWLSKCARPCKRRTKQGLAWNLQLELYNKR